MALRRARRQSALQRRGGRRAEPPRDLGGAGCAPAADRAPAVGGPGCQRQQGQDDARAAAHGVGTEPGRQHPLPAHLYWALEAQAQGKPCAAAVPDHRNLRRLSV